MIDEAWGRLMFRSCKKMVSNSSVGNRSRGAANLACMPKFSFGVFVGRSNLAGGVEKWEAEEIGRLPLGYGFRRHGFRRDTFRRELTE